MYDLDQTKGTYGSVTESMFYKHKALNSISSNKGKFQFLD